jgi:broad specificity phosphatase PhoE
VAVRLRQLISVLETQYSGDVVLVVAGDGTTLALLSCMMAGIPFDHVHELEYKPGEVRLNVTMDSTLAFWKERQSERLGCL